MCVRPRWMLVLLCASGCMVSDQQSGGGVTTGSTGDRGTGGVRGSSRSSAGNPSSSAAGGAVSSDPSMCIPEASGCSVGPTAPVRQCCAGLDCSTQEGKCRPICMSDADCPHSPLNLVCQGSGGPKRASVCIFSNNGGPSAP